MPNSTLFTPAQDFAPTHNERESSPLYSDKTPFIVCVVILGLILASASAWAIYSYRRKRDLEKLDEESATDGTKAIDDESESEYAIGLS